VTKAPSPNALVKLGVTTYEAKAYLALIRRDSSTAAEVSRLAGVPRQRIYDVLASLVEKGLASHRPGSPVKYAPTPPDAAIGRLLSDRRSEVDGLERAARAMIDELQPAFAAGKTHSDPLEFIEVLREPGAISERFNELQAAVKDEILVFNKPPYATPPEENVEGLRLLRQHTARGIYEFSLFENPAHAEGVRRFVEAGEEARFVEQLPLKLVIIDETIVMFGMEDPVAGSSELTIMVVEHPQLAKVLKIAFLTVWGEGLTFHEAAERLDKRAAAG
jgi:sugar-specific transcriptional regulator TrmB